MKRSILLFCLLSVLSSGPVWALEHARMAVAPVIQVAFVETPVQAYLDAAGQPAGKAVEFVQRLLKQAGYRSEIRLLPVARIWKGLQDGSVHLWLGLANKPELAPHTLLTQRPLGSARINLYHHPDRQPPLWPSEIAGSKVILMTNFTYVESLQRVLGDPELGLRFTYSNSHEGAVRMLLRRRGDYLLSYDWYVDPVVEALGVSSLPYVRVSELPVYCVLSKHMILASQLKDDLDRAYDELLEMGLTL